MKISNHLKYNLSAVGIGCLALGLNCASAAAATATTTFQVSATVAATCSVTATPLAFGIYTSTAVSNSTSTVSVTCTNGTGYTVGLDAGLAGGAVTTRKMTNGANSLNYALYSDAGHTANWGNSSGSWVSGTGNGLAQPLTVNGQVAANQYVTP